LVEKSKVATCTEVIKSSRTVVEKKPKRKR
jgi:hypothetical protein